MAEEVNRSLSYRRAVFPVAPAGNKTLEHFVIEAHQKLKLIADRQIVYSNGYTLEGRHQKRVPKQGHLLHIVAYTKDERASVVPEKSGEVQADIGTLPPPPGLDFMDGDLMGLVSGNHVIICKSQLHESKLEVYLKALFEKAGLHEDSAKFHIEKTADVSIMQAIQEEGIRSIAVDATLYEATIAHQKRKSTTQKLAGALMDEVITVFSKDANLKDVLQEENLSAEIVFSFDGRRKGDIGPKRLDYLAREIVKEDEYDGFTIETREGSTIRGDQITRKKVVQLPKHGKTVSYDAAFSALGEYFLELKAEGLTEQ